MMSPLVAVVLSVPTVPKLTALPVNAEFHPLIERFMPIGRRGSITVFGVDSVIDPTAAVVSSDAAERFGWKEGSVVRLHDQGIAVPFRIMKVIPDQSMDWVAIDIAADQQLLNSYGKVDRINITVDRGEDGVAVEKATQSAVPFAYDVISAGARTEENQRMLRAFRTNLGMLSYISLLVGAFLIYNTIAVSVLRRRVEIGILRALGVSSRGVLAIFLGEAAMLGVVGSFAGIALGRFMASGMVGMISNTVNSIFVTSAPGKIVTSWTAIAFAVATGTAVTVISGLIPAREAARVAPADAMRRDAREHDARIHIRRDLIGAGIAAIVTIVLSQFGPIEGQPIFGYVATLFAIVTTALFAPAFVSFAIRRAHGALRKIPGAAGLIAGKSLAASLARTSIIVTALATAISMTISVGIMVASFRETVQVWLQNRLRADIYLNAIGPSTAGLSPPIASKVPEIVSRMPGVADMDTLHAFPFRYEGQQAIFGANNSDVIRRHDAMRFLDGNADAILRSLPGRDRVVVSEPFAYKHHVHVGNILKIPLGNAIVPMTVAGIYYDYSNHRGFVLADWSTMKKYLPDQPPTNVAIYLSPDLTPAVKAVTVRRALQSALADYPVSLAPSDTLRRSAVEIFDRTFAVTWALEGIAIIVAILGTANSLLALVLDRRREIGLIRYLGADDGQIRRMVLTEAGLVGLLASGLGLLLGVALSLELIYVINKQSFGWTIQFHPPLLPLAGALVVVWIVTIAAGIYPAGIAAKLQPADAVHEE